jgi:hypothetical protein
LLQLLFKAGLLSARYEHAYDPGLLAAKLSKWTKQLPRALPARREDLAGALLVRKRRNKISINRNNKTTSNSSMLCYFNITRRILPENYCTSIITIIAGKLFQAAAVIQQKYSSMKKVILRRPHESVEPFMGTFESFHSDYELIALLLSAVYLVCRLIALYESARRARRREAA